MPAPKNTFKQALREKRTQIGFWQALANPYTELGATFIAIGNDVTLFANATSKLLEEFKRAEPAKEAIGFSVY